VRLLDVDLKTGLSPDEVKTATGEIRPHSVTPAKAASALKRFLLQFASR